MFDGVAGELVWGWCLSALAWRGGGMGHWVLYRTLGVSGLFFCGDFAEALRSCSFLISLFLPFSLICIFLFSIWCEDRI